MSREVRFVEGVGHVDVELSVVEMGYLQAGITERAGKGDPIARRIYLKLRDAAIACGVVWYYGDPWPEAPPPAGGSEPQGGER